jgi:hypothetical protein
VDKPRPTTLADQQAAHPLSKNVDRLTFDDGINRPVAIGQILNDRGVPWRSADSIFPRGKQGL